MRNSNLHNAPDSTLSQLELTMLVIQLTHCFNIYHTMLSTIPVVWLMLDLYIISYTHNQSWNIFCASKWAPLVSQSKLIHSLNGLSPEQLLDVPIFGQ